MGWTWRLIREDHAGSFNLGPSTPKKMRPSPESELRRTGRLAAVRKGSGFEKEARQHKNNSHEPPRFRSVRNSAVHYRNRGQGHNV